jgi:hypothetical protein
MGVSPDLSRLSMWSTLRGKFGAKENRSPGIGDILYRAGHIGGLNQRAQTMAQADYYLAPPVGGFSMMSYRSSADIVEVGYRYAMEKIEGWSR